MAIERYNENSIINIRTRFNDSLGAGITNATGVVFIYRVSDNQYWNGAAFQAVRVSNPMIEVGETEHPGEWAFNFDSGVTGTNAIDTYIIETVDTSDNSVNARNIEINTALVGGWLDPIYTAMATLLGLAKKNYGVIPTEFSIDNKMTKGNAYIYDNATNAETNDGVTGVNEKFEINAPRSPTTNRLLSFAMYEVAI